MTPYQPWTPSIVFWYEESSEEIKDKCGKTQDTKGKKNNVNVAAIVVPIALVALFAVVFIIAYPKYVFNN